MALNAEGKGCGHGGKKEKNVYFARECQVSLKLNQKWKFSTTPFFTPLHIVIWMKNYCREKHLYFYCYCQMPSVSKYIFHYTTSYRHFKMSFLKNCIMPWKYIITMLNNFIFPRMVHFVSVIYCNHFAFNMNWTDILLQMNFLVTNFEIDRLKLIWGCQNTVQLSAQKKCIKFYRWWISGLHGSYVSIPNAS